MDSSKELLMSFIERIERINEDLDSLKADVKEIFQEAAQSGFDKKGLKAIIKIRKQDPEKAAEEEAIIQTYKDVLGM